MSEMPAQNDNSRDIPNAPFAPWDSTPFCQGASVSLPGAGKRDAITQLETAPCVAGFYANIACSETPQVWGGALFPSVELLPSRT